MNQLKKFLLIALISGISFFSNAQGFELDPGFKQVNFGLGVSTWGIPIYAGMDFGITDKISIGPRISYRSYNYGSYLLDDYNTSIFNLGFRGDYHYGSHIRPLPDQLDLYGGLTLGYSIWSNTYSFHSNYDGLYVNIQAGGRWYFNESWAANAELSSGSFSGLEIGLSYMF